MSVNAYPEVWFQTFLETISQEQTEHEVAFLERVCPPAEFPRLLDLCCGEGRHAVSLARRGFHVTGVDSSEYAISKARANRALPHLQYRVADVRTYLPGASPFDAVLILWVSFGYFEDGENLAIARRIHSSLRPGGRLVLDIYNRNFFEPRQGKRTSKKGDLTFEESNTIRRNRLLVSLKAEGGQTLGDFDWRVFSPDEIRAFALEAGFETLMICTSFDSTQPVSSDAPRMQVVLEKRRS